MRDYQCPLCGQGRMRTEIVPLHATRLKGIPIRVKDAEIDKCDVCGEACVLSPELQRWETVLEQQLQEGKHIPSPDEVRGIRERLGLSVTEFSALLGVTRQTIYGWEDARSGGIKLGPAALLVRLLGSDGDGTVQGVVDALAQAAVDRGQPIHRLGHPASRRRRVSRRPRKRPVDRSIASGSMIAAGHDDNDHRSLPGTRLDLRGP